MQLESHSKIIFGSFPFRGTMQSARLLCEYIGVEYQNKFFDPYIWEQYKKKQAKNWLYKEIPFLKYGDVVITNGFAAAQFIAEKYGRLDLLGTTEQQKIFMYSAVSFYSIILGALSLQCEIRQLSSEEKLMKRQKYWKQTFYPKFLKVDQLCHGPWFFSHLTIVDFFIYQDYLLFSKMYPQLQKLKKFKRVFQSVGSIPVIKKFQEQRAIKQKCPNQYFRDFLQQYKKKPMKLPCNQNNKIQIQNIGENQSKNNQPNKIINNNNNNRTGFCPYKRDKDCKMSEQ